MAGITLPDQDNVDLGNSRITPRETYAVDPRAIQNQYKDSVANANQLARALEGFGAQIGKAERFAAQEELKQKDIVAAQIMGSIDPNKGPIQDQVSALRPDLSPRLRAAAAESIGSQQGLADARKAYEEAIAKNPEQFNTPEGAKQFFDTWQAENAKRVSSNQFYGPAYLAAAQKYFSTADAAEARARIGKMKEEIKKDEARRLEDRLFNNGPTGSQPGKAGFGNFIGGAEGTGNNYNAYYGAGKQNSVKLTGMTIAQVMQFQKGLARRTGSSAAGRYQIMQFNMLRLAKKAGLDPNTAIFDQRTQDKFRDILMEERGYSKWLAGKMSDEQFAGNLAKEWASLATKSGKSAYHGDKMGNKASRSYGQLLSALKALKAGKGGAVSTADVADLSTYGSEDMGTMAQDATSSLFQNFQQEEKHLALRSGDLISRAERKATFIDVVTKRAVAENNPALLDQIPREYIDEKGNKQAFLTNDEYIAIQKARQGIVKLSAATASAERTARENARKDAHSAEIAAFRDAALKFYNDPANKGKAMKPTFAQLQVLQKNAPDGFDAVDYSMKILKSYQEVTTLPDTERTKIASNFKSQIAVAGFRGDIDGENGVKALIERAQSGAVPADKVEEVVKEGKKYLDPHFRTAFDAPEGKAGLDTIEGILSGQKGGLSIGLSTPPRQIPQWPQIRQAYMDAFRQSIAKRDPSNSNDRYTAAMDAAKAVVPRIKNIPSLRNNREVQSALDQFMTGLPSADAKPAPKPSSTPTQKQPTPSAGLSKILGK